MLFRKELNIIKLFVAAFIIFYIIAKNRGEKNH